MKQRKHAENTTLLQRGKNRESEEMMNSKNSNKIALSFLKRIKIYCPVNYHDAV